MHLEHSLIIVSEKEYVVVALDPPKRGLSHFELSMWLNIWVSDQKNDYDKSSTGILGLI